MTQPQAEKVARQKRRYAPPHETYRTMTDSSRPGPDNWRVGRFEVIEKFVGYTDER